VLRKKGLQQVKYLVLFVWRLSPGTLQTNKTQYTETGSNSDQKAIDVCRTRNQL